MARQVTLRVSGGNPKSPPLRAAVRILDVQLGKIQERTYIEVGYKDASQNIGFHHSCSVLCFNLVPPVAEKDNSDFCVSHIMLPFSWKS